MQQISIKPSARARLGFFAVFGLVSLLIALAGFHPLAWCGLQLAFATSMYRFWRNTAGIGAGLILGYERGWYVQRPRKEAQALLSVDAGWVTPGLATAQLQAETGRLSILVPSDALESSEHWQLRRLLINGLTETPGA